ncbi:MAG TPA: YihY/virulence factor BrkB family protein [Aquihabitans sp.]|nr:YihY/virulence factor BrkB family protein [Aquihabitans sp.]
MAKPTTAEDVEGTRGGVATATKKPGPDDQPQDPSERERLARQSDRGRDADRAGEIPAKGWKDIAKRVAKEVKADNVPLLAAGVAFYALLSLVPGIVAIVSIYGLVTEPAEVARQLESLTRTLPQDAASLITEQVEKIAGASSGKLGISVVVGILTALWSASSGMKWMLAALSLTYDEREERKFLKLRGTALLLTVGAAIALPVALGLIGATGALARALGLGDAGELAISVLRWPLLFALVIVGLAVLYKYGPDRDAPKWRWVSWGSVIAAIIWVLASAAFALYTSLAGNYQESYGSLAGVVVLMLWLFLTCFSVLLGSEINAEMEHQTAHDTTKGPDVPLGARGATVADEVGEPAD